MAAAVLGGLKRENKVSARSGIPGLKSVPYLKYLFSRSVESTQTSHIVITIELERVPAGKAQKVETAEMLPAK
jgi:type II secretory pathway component GspD/PulD (secretin)